MVRHARVSLTGCNNGQGNGSTEDRLLHPAGRVHRRPRTLRPFPAIRGPNGFCRARTSGTRRRITIRRSIAVPAATGSIRRGATQHRSISCPPRARITLTSATSIMAQGTRGFTDRRALISPTWAHLRRPLGPTAHSIRAAMCGSGTKPTFPETVRRVVCVAAVGRTTPTSWPLPPAWSAARRTRSASWGSAWQVFPNPAALPCCLPVLSACFATLGDGDNV